MKNILLTLPLLLSLTASAASNRTVLSTNITVVSTNVIVTQRSRIMADGIASTNISIATNVVTAVTNVTVTSTDLPPLPVGPADFIATVTDWLAHPNPDNTWTQKLDIAVGVASIQGGAVPIANSFRVAYDFIPLLGIESVTRDAGVGGTIVSEQGGLALNLHYVDLKGSFYVDGGYNKFQPRHDRLYGEIGLRVSKKVSRFGFMGIGLGEQFPSQARVLEAFFGVVF